MKTTQASVPRTRVGDDVHERRVVVPAVDEHELGVAPVERRLEPLAVLADRQAREVRRQHDADQPRRAAGERPVHRLGDPRPPVLHPDEDRDPELALERRRAAPR